MQRFVTFATPDEWGAWLGARHDAARDVWLQLGKKKSNLRSISCEQAVEEAVVWGWVGLERKPDVYGIWLQRFAPRPPRGRWTAKERAMAERLIAGGWMEDAGLAQVAQARDDGRWDAALRD